MGVYDLQMLSWENVIEFSQDPPGSLPVADCLPTFVDEFWEVFWGQFGRYGGHFWVIFGSFVGGIGGRSGTVLGVNEII